MGAGGLVQACGMWVKEMVTDDLESTGNAILSDLDFV